MLKNTRLAEPPSPLLHKQISPTIIPKKLPLCNHQPNSQTELQPMRTAPEKNIGPLFHLPQTPLQTKIHIIAITMPGNSPCSHLSAETYPNRKNYKSVYGINISIWVFLRNKGDDRVWEGGKPHKLLDSPHDNVEKATAAGGEGVAQRKVEVILPQSKISFEGIVPHHWNAWRQQLFRYHSSR